MKENGGNDEGGYGLESEIRGDDGCIEVFVAPQLQMRGMRWMCHEEVRRDGMNQHVVGEAPHACCRNCPRGRRFYWKGEEELSLQYKLPLTTITRTAQIQ